MIRLLTCAVVLTTMALAGPGCADADLFEPCPLDQTIQKVCDPGGSNAKLTCAVENHPQCPENVCLSWKGAPSTCTRVCNPSGSDCPSGSSCQAYDSTASKHYCVQDQEI